ncbi:MAG: D-alanyl-D-alanine carboxypeptidase family protein [Lachnospiraceae bacterium]|nr:D-alanyl-D-alanine carboxypeptidase family protein [Lachnospiraceae bacterium]
MAKRKKKRSRGKVEAGAIILGIMLLLGLMALLTVLIFMVRNLRSLHSAAPPAAAASEAEATDSAAESAAGDASPAESTAPDPASTAPAAESVPEPTPLPAGNPAEADNWMLILVNTDHPIPEGYEVPALTELVNGNSVDSRIYPSLQKMFDDARAQGLMPHITSSYRTYEDQQKMMDKKVEELIEEGKSEEEAAAEARLWVAEPGTSEHQLGLAVDVSTADWEQQDANLIWEWLNEHCHEYGFVQRYPEDKVDITGINNEPWHYRYVGEAAALEMTEKGLCLEEYVGQ